MGVGRASNLSVANALLNEAAADLEGGYVLVECTPRKVVIVTASGLHVGFGLEFTGTRTVTVGFGAQDSRPSVLVACVNRLLAGQSARHASSTDRGPQRRLTTQRMPSGIVRRRPWPSATIDSK